MNAFKENYATQANTLKAYGGKLAPAQITVGEYGSMTLNFNRDVLYSREVVKDFMPNYVEPRIDVRPSQAELDQAQADFDNSYQKRGLAPKRELAENLWERQVDLAKTIEERITVKFNEGRVYDTPEEAGLYNLSITLKEVEQKKLVIDVNFDYPEVVGVNEQPDILSIYLDFADLDPSFSTEGGEQKIGQVIVNKVFSKEQAGKVESVKSTAKSATSAFVGTAITTILITGAMSQVWSLLNGMQLFVHFPLIIIFPPFSALMVEEIVKIATLDLLTTFTFGYLTE